MAENCNYKLTYFDLRGHAEPIRLIFAYTGTNYQDVRVEQEKWQAMKSSSPFHSLPTLEVDGKIIGQSRAIMRFLAKRFNLAGKTDVEDAKIDALADYVDDALKAALPWVTEKDETKKAVGQNKYFNEILPEYITVFEEHLKKNAGGHGFLVGSGPTWVDFSVACFTFTGESMKPGILNKYPLLKGHLERVNNLKGIKEYIAKRPNNPYYFYYLTFFGSLF